MPSNHHKALLVLDLQNDFIHPDGKLHDLVASEIERKDLVKANLKLIHEALDQGVLTIATPMKFDYSQSAGAEPEGIAAPIVQRQAFDREDVGSRLIEEIEALGDDIMVIEKAALSAFVGTRLQEILESRGIEELVIAGLLTNFCVESTARDGFDRGYHVRIVSDATATFNAEQQAFAEDNIFPLLGKVLTVDQFAAA